MRLELPIKTVSEANRRDHWATKRYRVRNQQQEVWAEWVGMFGKGNIKLPCVVTLTRIGPKLLDDDNLRSAFKAIRDEMARIVGVDDGDPSIRFEYRQEAIGKRNYAIRIEVS